MIDAPDCDDGFGDENDDDDDVHGSGNGLCPAASMEKFHEEGEKNAFIYQVNNSIAAYFVCFFIRVYCICLSIYSRTYIIICLKLIISIQRWYTSLILLLNIVELNDLPDAVSVFSRHLEYYSTIATTSYRFIRYFWRYSDW